jgi:hypothetical protein
MIRRYYPEAVASPRRLRPRLGSVVCEKRRQDRFTHFVRACPPAAGLGGRDAGVVASLIRPCSPASGMISWVVLPGTTTSSSVRVSSVLARIAPRWRSWIGALARHRAATVSAGLVREHALPEGVRGVPAPSAVLTVLTAWIGYRATPEAFSARAGFDDLVPLTRTRFDLNSLPDRQFRAPRIWSPVGGHARADRLSPRPGPRW